MAPLVKDGPTPPEATVVLGVAATDSPPTFLFTAGSGTAFVSPASETAVVTPPGSATATRLEEAPEPGVTATRIESPTPPSPSAGGRAETVRKNELPPELPAALADPSRRIGRYALLAELGRGGMGVVARAYDTELRRQVALKMILDPTRAGPDQIERFRREASSAGRLRHPGIVAVHEVGEHEGRPYLVMELVPGRSLEGLLREAEGRGEAVPPRRAAELVRQVALALQHAHENGVVHRDVKPENVLVDAGDRAHLTDFGLAWDESAARVTQTGQILGTPAYMAPEQAAGDAKQHGPWTDVYALGAVLFRALTGRLPFHASTARELIRKVQHEEPTAVRKVAPAVHPDLETIVARCLAKEPDRRYPSAAAVAEELRRFLAAEPIVARPVSRLERGRLWVRRNRKVAGLSGALLVAVGVGGASVGRRALDHREARREVAGALEAASGRALEARPAFEEALASLVRRAGPETTAELVARLDRVSEALVASARDALLATATPTADEARAGGKPIEGLAVVASAYLTPGASLPPEASATLARARARLEARAGGRERRAGGAGDAPLAAAQAKAVSPGDREVARLAVEALGRTGARGVAIAALGRFLFAELDPDRFLVAAEAIARLGGREGLELLLAHRDRHGLASAKLADRLRPFVARMLEHADWPVATAEEHFARARAFQATGDSARALEDYGRALALDPTHTRSLLGRGFVRATTGDPRGAIADLTSVIAVAPREREAWSSRAIAKAQTGQLKDAAADFTKAIELDPGAPDLFAGRGAVRARFEPTGARADYTEALRLDPTLTTAWFARGMLNLTRFDDNEGALADLTRVTDLAPEHAEAWFRKGQIRWDLDDLEGSVADFSRAIALEPQKGHYYMNRAVARRWKGDLEGALADADRAIELEGRSAAYLSKRAQYRRLLKDRDGALADARAALAADRKCVAAHLEVGQVLLESGDPAGAVAALSSAVRYEPKNVDALVVRGVARRKAGEADGALADFTAALTANPRRADPWVQRGLLRSERGERDAALADLDRAVLVNPRLPDAWSGRGWVKLARQEAAAALLDFDRACELGPLLGRAWVGRARAKLALGDREGARIAAARALELAPADPELRALAAVLEEPAEK